MSKFDQRLASPFILTEGAVLERLRRDASARLDPWVDHAALIYDPAGRAALTKIESEYLSIGRASDLPLIVFTPTWHANPERIAKAGLVGKDVIGDCVRFIRAVVSDYGPYAEKVLVGGLMGCRGDAYCPDEALTREASLDFHRHQIHELERNDVDFLCAATLPALSEAMGIAAGMSETELPYVLSFVIISEGTLLDGTPLHEAIATIDDVASRRPAFYMVNCVHPSVFRSSMTREMMVAGREMSRLFGLQANTSPRSPGELEGLPVLETEDPGPLADAMIRLSKDFGLRILGGCCGTDDRHIRAIATKVSALNVS